MAKIPEQVKEFLASYLVYVATVDNKGMPNVVPKGNLAILDDREVVFADLYSLQTKDNLKKNPNIALTVVNPAGYTGYQLKGKATIIEHGKAYDLLAKQVSGAGQLNHPDAKYAVKVKIEKILNIGY